MYISTSKCFPTIDCNPALQRVQFDQNLSPIRDNDPRVYRARVAWKGRRRYRLPLSWDIIGHGRAIRMPDWPHTTSISRGKLTRSWLNGKRYHTPPFRNWLVLEFQGINWQTPVPRLSVHIASFITPRQPLIMPYCSGWTESVIPSNRQSYQMYMSIAILNIVSRIMSRRERVSGPAPTKLLPTGNPLGQPCPWLLRLIILLQRHHPFNRASYDFTKCR